MIDSGELRLVLFTERFDRTPAGPASVDRASRVDSGRFKCALSEIAGSNQDGSFANSFEAGLEYTLRKVDEGELVNGDDTIGVVAVGTESGSDTRRTLLHFKPRRETMEDVDISPDPEEGKGSNYSA